MAVFVIYMVLGMLYESFIHPLTILSALPFAGFGALAHAMLLTGTELTRLRLRRHHHARRPGEEERDHDGRLRPRGRRRRAARARPRRSTRRASVRFRPIMMTTMAALMGTLPDRARHRRGRRVAAAARRRGGGRAGVLAAAHAVRDAGRLHVLRRSLGVGALARVAAQRRYGRVPRRGTVGRPQAGGRYSGGGVGHGERDAHVVTARRRRRSWCRRPCARGRACRVRRRRESSARAFA